MMYYEHKGICEICEAVFVKVSKRKKEYIPRYCKECLSDVRRKVGRLGALSAPRSNDDETIMLVKNALAEFYNINGFTPSIEQVCKEVGMSSKSFQKAARANNTSYSDIINILGIKRSGLSNFQKSVIAILHDIYPNVNIASEKTFEDLRNPTTNCKLKIDIYIESLKLAIECDGKQHYDEQHYFNKLNVSKGYTPVYVTDKIKDYYFSSNGIKLIRIPYKRNVTKKQILNCLK